MVEITWTPYGSKGDGVAKPSKNCAVVPATNLESPWQVMRVPSRVGPTCVTSRSSSRTSTREPGARLSSDELPGAPCMET